MKAAKAKTAALARKLVHASIADGEPSPARVNAVLELLRKRPDRERKALVDGLSQKTGRKLIVVERENPALIGGIRVRLGDDEYDASIAGKLARLAAL